MRTDKIWVVPFTIEGEMGICADNEEDALYEAKKLKIIGYFKREGELRAHKKDLSLTTTFGIPKRDGVKK